MVLQILRLPHYPSLPFCIWGPSILERRLIGERTLINTSLEFSVDLIPAKETLPTWTSRPLGTSASSYY